MLYRDLNQKKKERRSFRSLRRSGGVVFDAWKEGEETVQVFKVVEDGSDLYYRGVMGSSQFVRVVRVDDE